MEIAWFSDHSPSKPLTTQAQGTKLKQPRHIIGRIGSKSYTARFSWNTQEDMPNQTGKM